MKTAAHSIKTRSVWERKENPPSFQLTARDIEIVKAVFRHRFLQPRHLGVLLGGSKVNIARRCLHLWRHEYLERPQSQRPTRILTEQVAYGLGRRGASLLQHLDSSLRIGHLEWTETRHKQAGWPFLDHQLGIATFFVALKVACDRLGIILHWDGHFHRKRHIFSIPGEQTAILPDGFFRLEIKGRGIAHHYLEIDRGSVSFARMRERYRGYYRWLCEGYQERTFKNFRVLTITQQKGYMDSLRRVASQIADDWQGLLFSHTGTFSLDDPHRILKPIFYTSSGENPVGLV